MGIQRYGQTTPGATPILTSATPEGIDDAELAGTRNTVSPQSAGATRTTCTQRTNPLRRSTCDPVAPAHSGSDAGDRVKYLRVMPVIAATGCVLGDSVYL